MNTAAAEVMPRELSAGPQREWPTLRQELTLHKGPCDASGAPTWTLHDPVRNQYFSLDWVAFHIVSRLNIGSVDGIKFSLKESTPLHIEDQDIESVLDFLEANELVQRHSPKAVAWLSERHARQSKSFIARLIHGYLFFRVPLFKPDKLLSSLASKVDFFYSPLFFKLSLFALFFGLWGVFRQWSVFSATLVDTFSWQGIVGYAGALIVVKVLHEFGHALTAKRMGCRVPTMGVAFLVMFPMAYTDVTESWKLDSHHKRFKIAGSGIATEMIVAIWMLLLWSVLPEGNWRGVTFFLATTSLTATLLINASPFMRFDGYFLLSDLIGMPNLHQRSFAMAKWWLRERLFRLDDRPPEAFSRNQIRLLVFFAFAVWLYRFVIFIGIALLVYHYFFKALGVFLFVVEIWFFLTRPIVAEIGVWLKRRDEIRRHFTKRPAHYFLLAVICFLFIPFDVTVNTQGMLKPENSLNVFTHVPAQIVGVVPKVSTSLSAGQVLVQLESPELDHKIKIAQARIDSLSKQVGSAGFLSETKAQQTILREQLANAEKALDGLLSERSRLIPIAPFDGKIVEIQQDIHPGDWVPRGQALLTFINENSWIVDCYVDESDLERISVGNWGRFVPDTPSLPSQSLKVISVDKDRSRVLADPPLASTAGGQILVRPLKESFVPERAIYRVRLEAQGPMEKVSTGNLRGSVTILGWPQSIFGEFLRGAIGTMVREAGF